MTDSVLLGFKHEKVSSDLKMITLHCSHKGLSSQFFQGS